ncbi:four helix bundle protein [Echinicola jeungdonensis]|uniref:Four helix bundle protein n=1 Tax=Echinicola jeungdonensis TaxID=709343 RepID=A0ABV5J2W2_9BACT|nr:four helix bundle protein [Echinicola jeungdonensis]MDN3668130.1 four helix bundle protein [Echinicola jeungdonensis]
MRVNTFEELEIWKEARELSKFIRKQTKLSPFCRDFRFCAQINSASGSIMDNIAEGFERDGNKEFIQFLYIAKGSCGEVRSQSYRALDAEFISLNDHREIMNHTESIKYKINGLINTLKNSGGKGYK